MKSLGQVLWEPVQVFERIREGTHIAPVAVVSTLMDLAMSLALIPYLFTTITHVLEASGNANLLQGSLPTVSVVIAVVTGAFSNLVLLAVVALLLFLASLALGGTARYRDIFGVLVLASVPSLLGRIGRTVAFLAGITQDPKVSLTSLSGLITGDGSIHALLRAVDVLDVWALMLVVVGFGVVSGLPKIRSYVTAGLLWGGLQVVLIKATLGGGN